MIEASDQLSFLFPFESRSASNTMYLVPRCGGERDGPPADSSSTTGRIPGKYRWRSRSYHMPGSSPMYAGMVLQIVNKTGYGVEIDAEN